MPEMLDPTSRITTLCRQQSITIGLMTDAPLLGWLDRPRHRPRRRPRRFLGGPIALIDDGDTIVVDLNTDRLDCRELSDPAELATRTAAWQAAVDANGGTHPDAVEVTSRVLLRMRALASPALQGGGLSGA